MSVVDLRKLRAASERVLAEPELRIRGPLPASSATWHKSLCEMVSAMLAIVGDLSPTDIRIVEAVRRSGSVRAAAKELAPGSPSYRAYVQRRIKILRARFEAVLR